MTPIQRVAAVVAAILVITVPYHDLHGEDDILIFLPGILGATARPPTAYDQIISVVQNTSIDIDLEASGPSGSELTYSLLIQPEHGTLIGTAPNVTYQPDSGYSGKDLFSFRASNEDGDSEPATIVLYVIEPRSFLHNLIVDFAPYNSETGRAGAFVFRVNYEKVFWEFGTNVLSDHQGGLKDNPAFEYLVASDADVYSPVDGTVVNLIYQPDSQDYELHIAPQDINVVWLDIDHVKEPAVALDDVVTAGQVIGKPGSWDEVNGIGRVELQINLTQEGESVCPFIYFNPDTRASYENGVNQLIQDWEQFKGNALIYSEELFPIAGCNTHRTGM